MCVKKQWSCGPYEGTSLLYNTILSSFEGKEKESRRPRQYVVRASGPSQSWVGLKTQNQFQIVTNQMTKIDTSGAPTMYCPLANWRQFFQLRYCAVEKTSSNRILIFRFTRNLRKNVSKMQCKKSTGFEPATSWESARGFEPARLLIANRDGTVIPLAS